MKFSLLLIPLLAFSKALPAEPAADFLRFKNGNTLHGQYLGLDEGPIVKWSSPETAEPIPFITQNLRKLSFNNGRALQRLKSKGMVELNNGDRLPGEIIAMGGDSVSLQTEFAGLFTIPRADIVSLQPNRHGGRVVYAGPFNEEEWSSPGEDAKKEKADAEDAKSDEGIENEDERDWFYGIGTWYNNSNNALRLNTPLPDQVSIRFQLAWKTPLDADIAIFSDFLRPRNEVADGARVRRVPVPMDENAEEPEEEPEEKAEEEPEPEEVIEDIMTAGPGKNEAELFGSGYLLTIHSSYSRLQRLSFNEKGLEKKNTFPNSGGRLSLGDLSSADFEIRADREKGQISLFVNGEYYTEWQDLGESLSKADRYFAISAGSKSRLRISDVVVSEWNGMPDSARSMESNDRDVLLLANGTDRISGKILTMEEDVFRVESEYGIFQIPASEVTDIRLAKNSVNEAPETSAENILVSLQPSGLLTLNPKEGQREDLRGEHQILGDLVLDLRYAYLIEFDPISSIFDNWDDEF